MRRWWVYGVSLMITSLCIGGTLFFFMKTPGIEVPHREPLVQQSVDKSNIEQSQPSQATPVNSVEAQESLNLAVQYNASGDLVKAREVLKAFIQNSHQGQNIQDVEKEFWDTNIKLLFSDKEVEGWTRSVEVKKGDSLTTIAKQNHTTVDLLLEANHLASPMIHPGQNLRVFTGEVSILVNKSLNTLSLKINGEVIKVYRVGTGVGGSSPVGDFKIINKIPNPPWHHEGKVYPFGDPQNILGTRWMGFNNKGFGLHGTWDRGSVGSQSSAGCVRLLNEEVEELFKIVPVGTVVSTVE